MNVVRIFRLLLVFSAVLVMSACGGGGNTTVGGDTPATVSGAVEFPAAVGKQTAKQVNSVTSSVIIEIYSVDTGQKITGVTVTVNDSAVNANSYTYTTSGLTPNINYVFKASRGNQVVRRYIPSTLVISGASVTGQTVDSVSTATVILVQTKLNLPAGIMLGESALPSGVSTTAINNVQPTFIETSMRNDISNGTDSENVKLVTTIKLAVAASTDPVKAPTTEITSAAATASSHYTAPATNADAAAQYVTQAKASLVKQDVAAASTAFEAALVADPANKDANFGGALTKIVMMIDDPKVKDIIAKWGVISPSANQVLSHSSPVGNPFKNWTSAFQKVPSAGLSKTVAKSADGQDSARAVMSSFNSLRGSLPKFTPMGSSAKTTAKSVASSTLSATVPTVTDMQVLISGTIIPSLQTALARLQKTEGTSYSFVMTKAMQGNPVSGADITLNDGEIYALETAINAFLCVLNIGVSYDLDVYDYNGNGTRNDYDKVGQDPLKTINQSTFFTLKSTGAASMAAGLTALQGAVTSLDKAYTALKNRTAGQGAFDLTNLTAKNKSDFEKFLGYAKKTVAGQTDISYNNGTKTIAVDITKFFTKPLTRANAPTLGYDVQPDATLMVKYNRPVAAEQQRSYQYWNGSGYSTSYYTNSVDSEIVPTSDISDYTLNGILPNNTAANNIAQFTGILPVISGKLLSAQGGGDPLALFYNSYSKNQFNTSLIYLSYNSPANTSVYKLDTTTGVISAYCTSVTGIPTGYSYQGLSYYPKPEGEYARLSKATSTGFDYEYRPITVANQVCTIGSPSVKTISIATGKSFTLEMVGSEVDMLLHNVAIVSTPYSYALYSTTDPTKTLLTLTDSSKQFFGIRNGVITVRDNMSSELLQYQVASDGKSAQLSGTFTNIDFTGYGNNGQYSKVLSGGSGYYWLFDGYKMIQYAGKPDGGRL